MEKGPTKGKGKTTVSGDTTSVDTVCLRCHQKCHLVAQVQHGKIVGIDAAACIKGETVPDVMYHPDRVLHPLKRIGARGEGKWQRITWDEAISSIAGKLKSLNEKYGPQQLYITGGSGQKQLADQALNMAKRMFPAPNIHWARYTCVTPATFAGRGTVGERLIYEYNADYENSKCIVFWGSNPDITIPWAVQHARSALKKGAKLMVIDPRPIPMSKKADIWLRIRPGTDAALALGMANVIINENLYDKEFVDKWCHGFKELKEHVKKYPVDKVAETTWLSKEDIIKAARLYATTKPACIYPRLGAGAQHINATQTGRAICILVALTGNVDADGGNSLFERPFYDAMMPSTYMTRFACRDVTAVRKMFGYDTYPILAKPGTVCDVPEISRGMQDGRVRSLWACGDNFISAEPNAKVHWEAMKDTARLELIWVNDYFMTPTAELADFVLPAAFYQEVDNIVEPFVLPANYVTAAKKVVEPAGECRDDRQVAIDIAKAMGVDTSPWDTVMDYLNWNLRYQKITFEELWNMPGHRITCPRSYRKYEKTTPAFLTPTGKCELYSTLFEKFGVAPLPEHIEPPDGPVSTPELYKEYPLIYTHYRIYGYMHTEGRQIERQRKLTPDPVLEIAPETATKYGISNGDLVWLELAKSQRKGDRVTYKARLVPDLLPELVAGPHGWWFPEKTGAEHGAFDSNINALLTLDPPYDPVVGTPQCRGVLCRIGKVTS